MAKKIVITQTKSLIGQSPRHRRTMETLGLGRIGNTTERERTEVIDGQIRLVEHLVKVEEK